MSRTSNLYLDTDMLSDTCCRIQVARSGLCCWLYLGDIIAIQFTFMSRSTCITLYSARRATNWQQFCRRHKKHVDGNKWIQVVTTCVRQHVSWCKRGFRGLVGCLQNWQKPHSVIWEKTGIVLGWALPNTRSMLSPTYKVNVALAARTAHRLITTSS